MFKSRYATIALAAVAGAALVGLLLKGARKDPNSTTGKVAGSLGLV